MVRSNFPGGVSGGTDSVLIITQALLGIGEVCLVVSKIDRLNESAAPVLEQGRLNAIKDGQSVVWVDGHLFAAVKQLN